MNGDRGVFGVSSSYQELDLTEVLVNLLRSRGKLDEKFIIHRQLIALSAHGVELAKILSNSQPELRQRIVEFLEKRIEANERSLRIKKIFAFWSSDRLQGEAFRRSIDETCTMLERIRIMGGENLDQLADNNKEILRSLSDVLIHLVLNERDPGGDVNTIRRMLGGGERR